jgi:hypothetical protein
MTMRFNQNAHADHATLVLVIDREADSEQAAVVKRHLESCPDCRARMTALQAAVLEFDIAYSERGDSFFPPADGPRARLQARLSVIAAEQSRSPWKRFLRIPVPVMRLGYLTGAGAAIALTAIIMSSVFAPAISAKEFLVRASAAQSAQGPTIRPLRIRLQGKDFNRKSEERLGRRIFAEARLDWDDPLSPAAFARWHDSIPEKDDEVTRSKEELTLRTTTKADPVEEASFTVKVDTWIPVSETFKLRDGTNVEITTVPNPPPVEPDNLGGDLPRLSDSKPSEPESARAAESSLSKSNEVTVEDSEVFARVALHKIGAEKEGQIEFRRLGANTLSVSTLVESEERRQSLATALAAIPGVRLDIRTIAEAAGKSSGSVQRPAQDTAVATTAIPGLQSQLETLFPDPGRRETFVNSVLTESQRASEEAWETGVLVRRYREADVQRLGSVAREALEQLIRQHFDALSQAIQQTEVRIRPMIESPQPDREADAPLKPWREELLILTQRTLTMHERIQEALIASAGGRNGEQLRAWITSDLQWLKGGLEAPRRATSQHFLKNEGFNQSK